MEIKIYTYLFRLDITGLAGGSASRVGGEGGGVGGYPIIYKHFLFIKKKRKNIIYRKNNIYLLEEGYYNHNYDPSWAASIKGLSYVFIFYRLLLRLISLIIILLYYSYINIVNYLVLSLSSSPILL